MGKWNYKPGCRERVLGLEICWKWEAIKLGADVKEEVGGEESKAWVELCGTLPFRLQEGQAGARP